jgi:hypothetical protein
MNLVSYIEQTDKFPDVTEKVKKVEAIYRKMAYLEANKWLKDSDKILRYKGKKDIKAFASDTWPRSAWALISGAVVKPAFLGCAHMHQLKKRPDSSFEISFKDGQGYQSPYYGRNMATVAARREWRDRCRAIAGGGDVTWAWETHRTEADGIAILRVNYKKSNLVSTAADRISFEKLATDVEALATLVKVAMEGRVI